MPALPHLPHLPFNAPVAYQQLPTSPQEGVTCFFSRLSRAALPMRMPFHGRGFGLSFLIAGHGALVDRHGQRLALTAGSFFRLVGDGLTMHYAATADFSECCLYLSPRITDHLSALGCIEPRPPVTTAGDAHAVVRGYAALYHLLRPGLATSAQVVSAVIGLFELSAQEAPGAPRDAVLDQVRERLGRDLDQRVSLHAVAAACGLSYRAMYDRFRRQHGITPGSYRIRCRLQAARGLLDRFTVQETAARLGYPDAFTFSRQFRRYAGVSPLRYQTAGEPLRDTLGMR